MIERLDNECKNLKDECDSNKAVNQELNAQL